MLPSLPLNRSPFKIISVAVFHVIALAKIEFIPLKLNLPFYENNFYLFECDLLSTCIQEKVDV